MGTSLMLNLGKYSLEWRSEGTRTGPIQGLGKLEEFENPVRDGVSYI